MEALVAIIGVVVSALLTVLVSSVNRLNSSISRIYAKIEEFRVHVAEHYVTKDHLKDFCNGKHDV